MLYLALLQRTLCTLSIITESEAADILINPKTLRQLEPFLGKACTVSQAAQATGDKANTILARVKRFLKLGLIEIVKEEKQNLNRQDSSRNP